MTKETYKKAELILGEMQGLGSLKYELSQCREYTRLNSEHQASIFEHIDTLINELRTKFNEL